MSEEKRNYEIKPYDKLCFSDAFMFGKVMLDRDLSRDLLKCLLQRDVGELQEITTEKEYRHTREGKQIRMDLYSRDETSVYDTEMMNLNHKPVKYYQLPRRSRFYQSSIDMDHLDRGGAYKSLPDSTIIFICTFDPFKRGLARYTFENRCREDETFLLGDGVEKIFFNCTYKEKVTSEKIPEEIRQFYTYMQTGRPCNDLTGRIDAAVREARKREEWRSDYMMKSLFEMDAIDAGRELGIEMGREEGREEGNLKHLISQICKKISKGKDIPTIADDLEEDDVKVIERICSIAAEFAPDYDVDKIFKEYSKSETADVS